MPEIRSPEDSIFPQPGEGIKTTQMYGISGNVSARSRLITSDGFTKG